jgi:serine/threonine-protein kinase
MGAVYAGVHTETGQHAAIKVLSEALAADPRFRERFRAEVETLKKLRHRNIVTLQGYGEEEGCLYFVMELVQGHSLEAEQRVGRRFEWQEVVDLAVQICAALKHAHDHGVIHRDLKPANLLLTSDGTVKLTDFGIAKFFGGTNLTLAGSMIGTPEYMSPEQTEGTGVTVRSDLYSLGCVMYSLLAGRPPFQSASMTQMIDRVRFEVARPVRWAAPQTPEELDQIISQLLRKNPDERIATAQALSNLLQAMKHALILRDQSSPEVSSSATAIRQGTLPGTAAPGSDHGPTSIAPDSGQMTLDMVAPPPASARAEKPGVSPYPADSTEIRETIDYSGDSEQEDVEREAPKTQFTPVSQADWQATAERTRAAKRSSGELLPIFGLGAALLAVVAVGLYLWLPPSADRLYGRLQSLSREPDQAERYERSLSEFLARFPQDPRAAEVEGWRKDLQCRWLQEELSKKVRSLTAFEDSYLAGMQLAEQKNWKEAQARFQQVVDEYRGDTLSPTEKRLYERAQHMLEKSISESGGQ